MALKKVIERLTKKTSSETNGASLYMYTSHRPKKNISEYTQEVPQSRRTALPRHEKSEG